MRLSKAEHREKYIFQAAAWIFYSENVPTFQDGFGVCLISIVCRFAGRPRFGGSAGFLYLRGGKKEKTGNGGRL